jgi:hypothetical protein
MNKFLLLSSLLCTMLLSSCGFLLSPFGEELIVDGAQEVIKLEQELTHTKTTTTTTKETEKEPVKETSKESVKEVK